MRVLVCGSRTYTDRAQLGSVLTGLFWGYSPFTIVEGAANGADQLAYEWALQRLPTIQTERHPARWNELGRRAGYVRNIEMLDSGVELVVAFLDQEMTQGTSHTVTEAKKRGLPVWEIYSNKSALEAPTPKAKPWNRLLSNR